MSQNTAYKLTLKTGKTVVFREPKIKDETTATQLAATKAQGTSALQIGPHLLIEMTKLLLVSINDKAIAAKDKESLEELFTYREWQEVKTFLTDMIGGDSAAPKLEMITVASQAG
jgi:hypothetical protein